MNWKLPDEEGAYWLTARMTGEPGRPVLSQRFVHGIKPPSLSQAAKQRTFIVLGSSMPREPSSNRTVCGLPTSSTSFRRGLMWW